MLARGALPASLPVPAIVIGESLIADQERVLDTDHSDTLAARNNLANAYRAAGRPPAPGQPTRP